MARGRTKQFLIQRLRSGVMGRGPADLIVEEPLQIRLDDTVVATTMRTPGNDFELVAGFCYAEGYFEGASLHHCRYCATGSAFDTEFNVVAVETDGRGPRPRPRISTTSSSCGMCGAEAIAEMRDRVHPLPVYERWDPSVLIRASKKAPSSQDLFALTGAVHAAAAFDRSGALLVSREDIGRHNAVDKVAGRLFLDGELPAKGLGLFVSGRASFEIVQKAWAAGFEALVAVSAPSALAVETAAAGGLTLVGFVRGDELNVYTRPDSARH